MLVTLLGITKFVTNVPFRYKLCPYLNGLALYSSNSILYHATKSDIYTEFKLLQFKKAYSPMFSTLLLIVTEVKPLQPEKALLPIIVTLFGIAIVSKFPIFTKPLLGISVKSSVNLIMPLPPSYGRISYSGQSAPEPLPEPLPEPPLRSIGSLSVVVYQISSLGGPTGSSGGQIITVPLSFSRCLFVLLQTKFYI